jgi:serine acetyltransferase
VGKHCVVGAGSVVTKPLPDYAIAVGVPAKVIRYRDLPRAPQPKREELEIASAYASANELISDKSA